jgi:VWFA-related protein
MLAQESPTFRAETLVVEVPVVVRKRGGGAPVDDLQQSDFRLFVSGKPVAIEWFSVTRAGSGSQVADALPALPQGFVRNRASDVNEGGRVVALVVDTLNARFEDVHFAIKGAIGTLETIHPDDRVGLYVMNRLGAVAVHDFSDDRAELMRRLRQVSSIPALFEGVNMAPPAVNDLLLTNTPSGEEAERFKARMHLMHTLRSIQGVSEHLSYIPGRKALIWITAGFDRTAMLDNLDLWNRSVERVSAANVAIYGVDSAGVRTHVEYRAENGAMQRAFMTGRRYMDPIHEMADRTGGRVYMNTNNISGAIRDAIRDSEVVYTLGFTARDEQWKGAYRRIQVRVGREGVSIRHREGYLARLPEMASEEECERQLTNTMLGSVHATGIPLAGGLEDRGDARYLVLLIEPQGVVLQPQEGRQTAEFRMRVVTRNQKGEPLEDFTDTITLAMTDTQFQRARAEGLRYTRILLAPRGPGSVKAAVMNRVTGQLGSITVPTSA